MGILYLIVILIFSLYSYARYKQFAIIQKINKYGDSKKFIPMLAIGNKLKAFTIERTELVYASCTINIDFISYFMSKIGSWLGLGGGDAFKLYKGYAKNLCYGYLRDKSEKADYIINIRESIKRVGSRKISVFLYGNAIYRYADTLPIYTLNVRKLGEGKSAPKAPLFRMLSDGFLQLVVAVILIKITSVGASNYLVNHLSLKDEMILWSYVDNVTVGEHSNNMDLMRAEGELQALLDSIPIDRLGDKYKFFVHIYDDENVNVSLYPAGHIVMTRGFVERLKYKNQALFALAHMIEHYNNGDHISSIRDKIINLKLIATLFGEESFIGKLLVWHSDFDRNYNVNQEIMADEFALEILNETLGSISGSDIFKEDFYNITNTYIKLFNTHPFSSERNDAVASHIAKRNFTYANEQPLNYALEDVTVPSKITAGEQGIDAQFSNLLGKYREEMNNQYAIYQKFLSAFNNILQLNHKLTVAELNKKRHAIDRGSFEIAKYNADFNSIINYYDKEMNDLIHSQQDSDHKKALNNLWQNEKSNVLLLLNFYMERDRMILEAQSILVQFLTTRFGSYNVTKNGIEFQTNKEKSDYNVLQKRIEELLKKAPPNTDYTK